MLNEPDTSLLSPDNRFRFNLDSSEFLKFNLQGSKINTPQKPSIMLVDFWATWCYPCLAEIPYLQEIAHDYEKQGLQIISLSLDGIENKETWTKKVSGYGENNINNYLLYHGMNSKLVEKLDVSSLPRYILLDKEGNIAILNAPKPSDERLRHLINRLLEE